MSVSDDSQGKSLLLNAGKGFRYSRVGNDCAEFFLFIDTPCARKCSIRGYPLIVEEIEDILMGFESMDRPEKIRKELVFAMYTEKPRDCPAGCHLRAHKVEQGVIHIEQECPHRLPGGALRSRTRDRSRIRRQSGFFHRYLYVNAAP